MLTALRQRLAEAETALDEAETAAMNAETAAMNLRTAVVAISAAEMAAADLGADADQPAIDAASALVTAARTAVAALDAAGQALLMSQVSSVNYMVMAAQTRLNNAATVAADTKAAGTKRMAIADEAKQGMTDEPVDADLGGTASDGTAAVDTYTLEIDRDSSGTEIKITDTANPAGADPANPANPQFTLDTDLGDGLTKHVRDNGMGVEEVVMVRTDIEAPVPTAFAKWEDEEGGTPQVLNVDLDAAMDADGDGTATNDLTALTVANEPAVRALVKAGAFSADTVATLTFAHEQEDGDTTTDGLQPVEAFETDGTYNGAMGTYRCNGDRRVHGDARREGCDQRHERWLDLHSQCGRCGWHLRPAGLRLPGLTASG